MGNALAIGQLVLNGIVLLIAVGHWGGKLERSRRNAPGSPPTIDAPASPNGSPSLYELVRWRDGFEMERRVLVRSTDLDDRLKVRDESNRREHDDLWGAIKDIRAINSAIGRRIDALRDNG